MGNRRFGTRWMLLLVLLAGLVPPGCVTKATTGAFTQIGRLPQELTRGVSTKMDVRRVLGSPKGSGNAVLPTDPQPREVWYYGDIEVTDTRAEAGIIRAQVRQQILLVFFEKGVFDGYMWWSNAGEAKGQ